MPMAKRALAVLHGFESEALFPSPLALGREHPGHLTRFEPLNPRTSTDPFPQPSPLWKGRGRIVGRLLASGGSGAGRIIASHPGCRK
jgi:hypothetical protein